MKQEVQEEKERRLGKKEEEEEEEEIVNVSLYQQTWKLMRACFLVHDGILSLCPQMVKEGTSGLFSPPEIL